MSEARVPVRRTAKLSIGGEFPRSESGRSYEVFSHDGRLLAWAARASRKDLRDAVRAARAAQPGWAAKTAYNRGQILYRVAELMEGRRDQFVGEVAQAEGLRDERAREVVVRAIDRWVWYAGWSDKFHQVAGSSNPVAGPYFDFSVPEPTGVVAASVIAMGLISLPAMMRAGYDPKLACGVICASVEYHGGTQSEAFQTIAEKIRANTEEVLAKLDARLPEVRLADVAAKVD